MMTPFEMAEAVVNVEVNDGPVALAEIYTAEGVAKAEKAKDEQRGQVKIRSRHNLEL